MISAEAWQKIRIVVLDADGVLTDGRIGFGAEEPVKFFHARDEHWIRMARRSGLLIGILSGSSSAAVRQFAKVTGMDFCRENCFDKLSAWEELLAEFRCGAEECCCIGDDVTDLPLLQRAGVGTAVADAVPELDEAAAFRTQLPGGRGAVAEVLRTLLAAQGKLNSLLERYRK